MLQIGDKITINKIGWSIYDLEGNYVCLRCNHAYLVKQKCNNCGAKRLSTGKFSDSENIDKEYKDTTVGRISKLIN